MSNPWLSVPLSDYEGHMQSPGVQQLQPLSELFAQALALRRPASVAIVGIAGGNGLDQIDPATTQRIVGLDINPEYLATVRERYATLQQLELHCVDLTQQRLELARVDLVHVALVFEHTGTGMAFENALDLVAPGGALSVVLQLPGDPGQDVGKSGYDSIQKHSGHFQLIPPETFAKMVGARGFRLAHESRHDVPAGKALWLAVFTRD